MCVNEGISKWQKNATNQETGRTNPGSDGEALIINVIGFFLTSIISGVLYRLGGMGDDGRQRYPKLPGWIFNTKVRDWGCPAVCLPWLAVLGVSAVWWLHLISFLLFYLALTTYWDRVFGYDNFYAHGFMCGLAYFPLCFDGLSWWVMLGRAVILGAMMGAWCKYFSNAVVEEMGRGGFLVLTLLVMLIK